MGCGTILGIFAVASRSKRHAEEEAEEEGRSHAKQNGKGFDACPSQSLFPRLRPGGTPLDRGGIQDGAGRAGAHWGGKTFQARPHVRCQGASTQEDAGKAKGSKAAEQGFSFLHQKAHRTGVRNLAKTAMFRTN